MKDRGWRRKYIYTYTITHLHIHTYTRLSIYTCTHTYTHVHMNTKTYTYKHKYMCIFIHVYIISPSVGYMYIQLNRIVSQYIMYVSTQNWTLHVWLHSGRLNTVGKSVSRRYLISWLFLGSKSSHKEQHAISTVTTDVLNK